MRRSLSAITEGAVAGLPGVLWQAAVGCANTRPLRTLDSRSQKKSIS